MAFRAKRLRVQLPCSAAGSLAEIDLGAGCDGGTSGCDAGTSACDGGTSLVHSGGGLCCDGGVSVPPPPPPPPPPPCTGGFPSPVFVDPWRGLWDPDDLPLLRSQLELALKHIEVAETATAVARTTTETRLHELDIAERTLQERNTVTE